VVVLIAYNLGEFVANDKGGVMHWSHHDPRGGQGGWTEYREQRYQ
jgi:hypothetical protein